MELLITTEKHNNFSLCLSDYCGKSFDNKDAINLRYTLLLIENGTGIAELDGNFVPYIAPCVLCINEKEHIVIPESDGNNIKAIFFHPSIMNSSLDFETVRIPSDDIPLTVKQDRIMLELLFISRHNKFFGKFNLGPLSSKKISSIYSDFHEQISEQNKENWPCRSRSFIMLIMFLLENLYSDGNFSSEEILETVKQQLHPILLYIYNNYENKITVSDITTRFYISKTALSKLFQDCLGETLMTYINKLRISIASTILRDTLLPINEIMSKVGFHDTVHFFRTFKRYTGYTPSDYREKFGWM